MGVEQEENSSMPLPAISLRLFFDTLRFPGFGLLPFVGSDQPGKTALVKVSASTFPPKVIIQLYYIRAVAGLNETEPVRPELAVPIVQGSILHQKLAPCSVS